MTERKCENNEMVAKKKCEEANTFAWWNRVLSTLAFSFGVVVALTPVLAIDAWIRQETVVDQLAKLKRELRDCRYELWDSVERLQDSVAGLQDSEDDGEDEDGEDED